MSYHGILGMNERNLKYIHPHNPKNRMRLVDDKLATKNLLKKHGLPTPRFLGVIRDIREFEAFNFDILPRNFVIKPNRGFGGSGIMVLKSKDQKKDFQEKQLAAKEWLDNGGRVYNYRDLRTHILDILDGRYSLASLPDIALLERKVIADPKFLDICGVGVPDVRVIVYNHVPVMAMIRFPTLKSKGRANLMTGGVGVGVDIASGVTTSAVIKLPRRRLIETHPDTGRKLSGFAIPDWDKILAMAIEVQMITKLGYLGVDIVPDKKFGPEIIELNARPGLEIQVANLDGLASRLERVKGLKIETVEKGVRVAADLFGGDIERRVENISGKEVIGLAEEVVILDRTGKKKIKVLAKIDTGADSTSIDQKLAIKLGYKSVLTVMNEYPLEAANAEKDILRVKSKIRKEIKVREPEIVELNFVRSSHGLTLRPYINLIYFLNTRKKRSLVNITDRQDLKYEMIIGRRDLKNFLVDPNKKFPFA